MHNIGEKRTSENILQMPHQTQPIPVPVHYKFRTEKVIQLVSESKLIAIDGGPALSPQGPAAAQSLCQPPAQLPVIDPVSDSRPGIGPKLVSPTRHKLPGHVARQNLQFHKQFVMRPQQAADMRFT